MWISAIYKDLPKLNVGGQSLTGDTQPCPGADEVGIIRFDRMDDGLFAVIDDNDNEYMLFHEQVDTSDIKEGVYLASWQDKATQEWMWAVAHKVGPTSYTIDAKHHVEPQPH